MYVERLIRFTLLVLIAALPWFLGGVSPMVRAVAAGMLAVCLLPVVFRSKTVDAWRSVRWQLALLLAAIFIGLAQLNDSVADFVKQINPGGINAKVAFSTPPDSSETPEAPVSLHPPATRRELAGLLSAAVAFALGAALFAETRSIILLLIVVAVSGAAVSLFGIVQQLTWNGLIYWSHTTYGGQPFGPFVNRNNAGGFLEISIAAGLGLLIWRLFNIPTLAPPTIDRHRRSSEHGVVSRALWVLANLDGSILFSAAGVLVMAAAVLVSLSRGSFVAMCVGTVAALVLVVFHSRRTGYIWVMSAVVALSVAFTVWLGRSGDVQDRLATLFTPTGVGHDSRLDHWKTALRAVPDYWFLGSGLGTYRYAYPRFEQSPTITNFHYAENQYLDAMLSAGATGLTLMLASLAFFGYVAMRLMKHAKTSADYGIATTAVALFFTQSLHACFDFALYVPANYLLFAMLCGALSRRAAACTNTSLAADSVQVPSKPARTLTIVFGLVLVASLGLGVNELVRYSVCREAERSTRTTQEAARREGLSWIDEAIAVQTRAVNACPDDGEARIRLAELYMERYGAAYRRDIGNFPVSPTVMLWALPEQLFADAHLFARSWNEQGLENLRRHRIVRENLVPALREAREAVRLCPFSPFAQMLVAKLCFLDESPLDDAFYLDRVERLAGSRESWLYEIGALHLDAGRPERAFPLWKKCLAIAPTHEAAILHYSSGFLTPDQLLEKVLPESPETLARVARRYYAGDDQRADRELLLKRAITISEQQGGTSFADFRLRGAIALELGDYADAVTYLEKAATLGVTNPELYFDTAAAYAGLKNWDRATTYAKLGLHLSPGSERGRRMLTDMEAASKSLQVVEP